MRYFFLFLLSFAVCHTNAQSYIHYNRLHNRVDACILKEEYKAAAEKFDSLDAGYPAVLARHCFQALQIACEQKDTTGVYKWLQKCLLQGVPLWQIRANTLTAPAQTYPLAPSIINRADSFYGIYRSRINLPLAHVLDSMILRDQKYTQKVNFGFPVWLPYYYARWRHYNRKQYRVIQSLIQQYGYPGERVIGLPESDSDSAAHYKFFVRRGHNPIQRLELQYMLMHCYSHPRKDITPVLREQVALGNLEPGTYAVLADFMAEYGRGKYGTYPRYYQWFINGRKEDEAAVNSRRDSIGLPTLQQRKDAFALLDSVLKANIRNKVLSDL